MNLYVKAKREQLRYAAVKYHEARKSLGYWAGSASQSFAMARLNHWRNYYRQRMIELHEAAFAFHVTSVPPKHWKRWAFDEETGQRVQTA